MTTQQVGLLLAILAMCGLSLFAGMLIIWYSGKVGSEPGEPEQCSARQGQSRPQLVLRTLPEEQLRAGFLEAGPDSLLWRSVLAELDQFIIEVSDRPLPRGESISDQELRFHLGGQAALGEFREKLEQREREAGAGETMEDGG